MTAGHLLFAAVLTAYMGMAAIIEERDLIAHFGQQYQHYRQQVPMFIPRWQTSGVFSSKNALDTTAAAPYAEGDASHA
jgi:hypothetical protein